MTTLPALEINDRRIKYTGLYPHEESLGGVPMGSVYPEITIALSDDPVLQAHPFGRPLWFVNYYRKEPDGSFYGFKGMFPNGVWDTDEEGHPLLRVWSSEVLG